MGYEAKKTEHAGPKKGNGAYWGPKQDAKKESSKIRRRNWQKEIRDLERRVAALEWLEEARRKKHQRLLRELDRKLADSKS